MPRKKSSPPPEAAAAWRLMFEVLMSSGHRRTASLVRRGLTPNDARALWTLDVDDGRPIGDLAREWGCDPSNATFIVGRLEKSGFARRASHADDKRVKLVFLTKSGAAVRDELRDEYHEPPDEIRALTRKDLATLARILAKVGK